MKRVTVNDLKAIQSAKGLRFFDDDAMRAFRSTIDPQITAVPTGYVFVTSERYSDEDAPAFTVRLMTPDGHITNLSEFQEHQTLAGALSQVIRYVRGFI